MRPLLLIAGCLIAVNALVIGCIGLVLGYPRASLIDIHRPGARKPSNEEIGLVALLETTQLAGAEVPQIVLLGASVPAGAFPPAMVQSRLPGFTVSNLAMPAATMTEILQLLDEARWALPPRVLHDSVLVLGVNWVSFCPDATRYSNVTTTNRPWWSSSAPVTYVRKAADRSPPILGISHPLRAVLPRWLVLAGKERLRVWGQLREILPAHPGEWLSQRTYGRLQTRSMRLEQQVLEWFNSLSVEEQTKWFTAEHGRSGTLLDPQQFATLARLLDRATSTGMTVVIADMPLHSEHRRHFPALADYQARIRDVVAAHPGRDRVHLLDLTDALPDECFLDLGHAKADRVADWVDLLVDRLQPVLPHPALRRDDPLEDQPR